MIFHELELAGAFVLEPERHEDDRGHFARTFCRRELESHGIEPTIAQCSISFNHLRGTLRGMHWQMAPHEEGKLVRCTRGAAYDVILDLRTGSPTFKRWYSVTLAADEGNAIWVPPGFAHGFLTLEDRTEIFYQMSTFFSPESARGVRWNDPAFAIVWPEEPTRLSERDAGYPDFRL